MKMRLIRGLTNTLAILIVIANWNSASAAVGRTVGQAVVSSSGEALYSIPIFVPPGIDGLTPKLSLTYRHRASEGLSGVGWGVAGLSQITRCRGTTAQNVAPSTVELRTWDRYCLDGNQLKHVTGTYGAAGSTYRTEIDMIARVTAYGTAGNGPSWFKVEAKDGLIYHYGETGDSRIESLSPAFLTTARVWALSKIVDRSGNEIRFQYIEDGAPFGDYRISNISYRINASAGLISAGYRVDFEHENQPAADVDNEYEAGGPVEDINRLDRIDVWYLNGPVDRLVRRYELEYETSLSSANRSRLQSVQECAGDVLDCFQPTTFTYQDGTNGFAAEVSSGTTIPSGTKPLLIDINGDGRTDLVFSSSSGSGTWKYQLANASGGFNDPPPQFWTRG